MSDFWPYIEPDSDYSDVNSEDDRTKYQHNPENNNQYEVVVGPFRNPRILI